MKIAVTIAKDAPSHAPFILRGDYVDTIRRAGEIGYDAVELHIADPHDIDVHAVLSACAEARVSISSIGTGLAFVRDGVTLTNPELVRRQDALNRLQAFITLGQALNCVIIIGLIRGQVRDIGDRAAFEAHLVEALGTCIPLAEAAGVTLVLEAVNRYESDVFNTIEETIAFLKRFNSLAFKLHIDTFHMNIEEPVIAASIAAAGGWIGHVHIADSNRLYPGQGHYDFPETLAALRAAGYQGALSVECIGLPTSDEAAIGALRFLRASLEQPGL
ncbi:sugar phosphate isomerase/epimerase [Agrobacterium tumefaciens]|uniref:sugar phosphate isomerase/epimerase family protein n=1 Tax=Agrobacterium tumefaciens TaxID=358 RepID=UPI0015733B6D|nr:sugar phosphate isomerase/epimerase family protein [Agrobacterium tumefaciens]NTE65144.1 sugar phosphate isomerase/epimerase [Agrobacterium tumefaciens]